MHLILQAWIIRKMKVIVKVTFGLDQLQLNEFLGRKSAASFFFTEAEGRALLGLPKARDLNLIIFHCSVQSDSANPFDTHELPTPSQAKPEGVTLKPVTSSKRTGGTLTRGNNILSDQTRKSHTQASHSLVTGYIQKTNPSQQQGYPDCFSENEKWMRQYPQLYKPSDAYH